MSKLRQAYDEMLLGLVSTLEKRAGVGEVKLLQKAPSSTAQIDKWQSKFGLR
jgi:hypothetical protein